MEDLCRKIPLISKTILEKLDDKSFVNFKDASREITTNLKNERFYWIRVLRSYNCLLKEFKDLWARVVNRTPAKFVKKIVMLIDHCYKDECCTEETMSFSPQHIAAYLGKLGFYKYFVVRTGKINPEEPSSGFTPMHLAACHGKLEICQFIIANLGEKNPRCNYSVTPLHVASDFGHLDICRLIIENIQDKNPKDIHGETPLQLATKSDHLDICKLILENVSEKNPGDNYGHTLFHLAAERGYLDICKLFIANIQDKNPRNNAGYTPLHEAASEGHLDISELIIRNVQNKNPGNNDGNTPLHLAAEFGHMNICRLIIESMQKVNSESIQFQTSIPSVAVNSHICKLQRHWKLGPPRFFRYRKEKRGRNRQPTTNAPKKFLNVPPPTKFIIVNPMNNFGYTPIDVAERFGRLNICEYLNSVVKKEHPAATD